MLFSMTGFGSAKRPFQDKTLSIEIKSVNSKIVDVRVRSPFDLKEKENLLRKEVLETAIRGKIDVSIELSSSNSVPVGLINESLLRSYAMSLKPIAEELGLDTSQIIPSLLRVPEILSNGSKAITDEEWDIIESTLDAALDRFLAFKKDEGIAIEQDFIKNIATIEDCLDKIINFEAERIDKIRERISNGLEEFMPVESVDKNRFEQELIYYIEKIDFSEEKSRLSQHCRYFLETIEVDEISKGRNPNFISQEMGREINTLGAKAYHSDIQRLIVIMKDELEKIKEQTANIV
ncbi:MAG: YicC family protein [Saprospiraceae bacterium]|nr:YicC family protein [Candidatus Brachybacter algidus]